MKKLVFISCLCLYLNFTSLLYAQSPAEIIAKTKQAVTELKSVRTEGKTVTGSIDITYNESLIDYGNKKLFAAEKKGQEVLRSAYISDGITYMYNGMLEEWFRFSQDISPIGDVFDKDKLLAQFPDNFEEAGFSVKFLDDETIGDQVCYLIESKVVDLKKAAEFAFKFLDRFVSSQIASLLKENEDLLGDYLETYMSNSETRLWIAKDSFFIAKVLNRHDQATGPDESVSIRVETRYYDFNKPVKIDVPKEAFDSPMVSAEDLGINLR
ncbi:MAG: hypothetical protein K9L86_01450 [Candidatus Omnitrophica bacterium]|nr:hypothetical protein [Candidatus Omnitrophota bacterium]